VNRSVEFDEAVSRLRTAKGLLSSESEFRPRQAPKLEERT